MQHFWLMAAAAEGMVRKGSVLVVLPCEQSRRLILWGPKNCEKTYWLLPFADGYLSPGERSHHAKIGRWYRGEGDVGWRVRGEEGTWDSTAVLL